MCLCICTPMCTFYVYAGVQDGSFVLKIASCSAVCIVLQQSCNSMLQAASRSSCCFYMCLFLVVALFFFYLLHLVCCGLENLIMMNFRLTSIFSICSYFLPVWASSMEMPWECSAWTLILAVLWGFVGLFSSSYYVESGQGCWLMTSG